MSISKKHIRKIVSENFKFGGDRYGFLGQGFGKPNSYNPYRTGLTEDEERESLVEPVEDVWSGGNNLEMPIDRVKAYHGLEQVKEPEVLNLTMSEQKLRKIIRNALIKSSS
jgi:hypothetical protein